MIFVLEYLKLFFLVRTTFFQPSANYVYRLIDAEAYTNLEVSRTPGSTRPGMSMVSCLMEVPDAVANCWLCWDEGPVL